MNSRLPAELERLIFESAAEATPAQIPTFLLVASRVRIWLEPLLYRVIRANESANAPKANAVLAAMVQKPPSFFKEAVRHLFVDISAIFSAEETYALLRLCENVINFALLSPFPEPGLLPILAKMHIRHLHASLTCLFRKSSAIDLTHPLFTSVTHLEMFDHGVFQHLEVAQATSQLAALPALTHLAVNEMVTWEVLRAILARCRRLKLLINLWSTFSAAHLRAEDFATDTPFKDSRFVIASVKDWAGDWETGAEGGVDLWAAAEKYIAGKRPKKVPEFDWLSEPNYDHYLY